MSTGRSSKAGWAGPARSCAGSQPTSRRTPSAFSSQGDHPKIIRAARVLADEGSAVPVLLGDPGEIRRAAEDAGVTLEEIEIVNPAEAADSEGLARAYWERRQRRGVTLREARARVRDPLYHGLLLLKTDRAYALVVGADILS